MGSSTDWPGSLRWHPDLGSRDVSLRRVEDIAFTPMKDRLRNELITRTYGDLAEAMAELLGTENATWTTFGQWASHTIGRYLRLPIPGLGPVIAQAFGDGNRDVFADIARAHITFLATVGRAYRHGGDLDRAWRICRRRLNRDLFHPPGGPDGGTEDEFWASIRDPRLDLGPKGRNRYLVLGFRAYRNALTEADPEVKARLILLGNCLIGLHEQRLLSLAVSVGFRSWLRTLTTPWQLFTTHYRWRHRPPGRVRMAMENWWIHFATRHVIGVSLPSGTVRVGRAVPAGIRPVIVPRSNPVAGADTRSESERRRVRPIYKLSDDELLISLTTRLGVDGGPAQCWNDLEERMAFIAALFAHHQRDPDWFHADGNVVRPRPTLDLERELARHGRRIAVGSEPEAEPPPVDEVRSTVPSPLSDRQLDVLRTRSPDLDRLSRQDLDYDDINGKAGRRALAPIRADFARRRRRLNRPGGLLDPTVCIAARRLFRRDSTVWFLGLLMRSLPESYNSAIGAHALGIVSELATNAFRRTGETARFVLDMLADDEGWQAGRMVPGGPALHSVVGVRCMHAIVALRLDEDEWNHDRFGAPINLEDLLGATLTFCVPPIEMMDDLGMGPTEQDRNDYVRFWLGIGVLLGLPDDVVRGPDGRCLDYEQAVALSQAIRRRHHARSLDGVRLTEALLVGVVDGFPRFAGWLASGLMQVLGRDRVNRQLMVTVGPGRRRASAVAAVLSWSLGQRILRPVVRRLIQSVGRRWVAPFVHQGRTRPYRRPARPDDDRRRRAELRSADNWPADCPPSRPRDRTSRETARPLVSSER